MLSLSLTTFYIGGTPQKTWDEVVRSDLVDKGLEHILVQDTVRWKCANK